MYMYYEQNNYMYIHIVFLHVKMKTISELQVIVIARGVETLSQLPDILAYLRHSCSAPRILCIQFSFVLPDIH